MARKASFLAALFWALSLWSAGGGVAGAQELPGVPAAPALEIEGQGVSFTLSPQWREGKVFVPLSELARFLKGSLYWDQGTRAARLFFGNRSVTFFADREEFQAGGQAGRVTPAPFILENRLYVPARETLEGLGGQVSWREEESLISVKLPGFSPPPPEEALPEPEFVVPATDEEVELLARVINAEAYDEPFEGKVGVGAVVVNRLRSGRFGGSIREIIYRPGQFAVVRNGRMNSLPLREDSRRAALAALRGEDPTGGALYFNAARLATSGFWRRLTLTTIIGDQAFFR